MPPSSGRAARHRPTGPGRVRGHWQRIAVLPALDDLSGRDAEERGDRNLEGPMGSGADEAPAHGTAVLIRIQVVDLTAVVADGGVKELVCLASVGPAVLYEYAVQVFAVVVGEQVVGVLDVVRVPPLDHHFQEVVVGVRHGDPPAMQSPPTDVG